MIIEVDNVKGFRDVLPPESLKNKMIREVIEKYFQLYGFLPIETPVIEYEELLRPDYLEGEDETSLSRFKLKDRVGRNLALRYNLNVAFSRLLKQNPNMKLPLRVYQIGQSFRDEPAGLNNFRQFTQCNADIIGDASLKSEIDLLCMAQEILNSLEIEYEIFVNHKKLIFSLIESVELENPRQIMKELANLEKIGEDVVKSNLKKYGNANQILTLFKLLEQDLLFFKRNAFDGADELLNFIKECKKRHLSVNLMPSMFKNINNYSGIIFEIRQKGQNEGVAFGGRYDDYVGKYLGKKIPSVGISFGLEKVAPICEKNPENVIKVIITGAKKGEEAVIEKEFREKGLSCFYLEDGFSNAVEYAHFYKIPYVIFGVIEEKAKRKFKFRNVFSGEYQVLSLNQIVRLIKHSVPNK